MIYKTIKNIEKRENPISIYLINFPVFFYSVQHAIQSASSKGVRIIKSLYKLQLLHNIQWKILKKKKKK